MANIIKIKRSTSVATPGSLSQGELAYSEDDGAATGSGNLFIGTAAGLVKIGGNLDVTTLAGLTIFSSVTGDSGTATADTQTDSIAITGGTGISTVASDGPEGLVITNDSPNVDQNLWATVTGDTGTTSANIVADSLNIAGGTNIVTSVTGDAVTVAFDGTLSETSGGTGLATYTTGDLLYSDASNSLANLALGNPGEILTVVGSNVGWSSPAVSEFAYSSTVTAADPGAGTIRFDSVTIGSITTAYIDDLDGSGDDFGWALANLADGDMLTFRSVADSADYVIAKVNGTPTDNAGYWTVPLTLVYTGVIFTDTDQMRVSVSWFSQAPAGGDVDQNLWLTFTGDTGTIDANTITDSFAFTGGTGITTAVSGDAVTITNDSPNIVQDLWDVISSDSGSTTANTATDTLTIAGGTGISTAIATDTLTITNDSPNVDQNLYATVIGDSGTTTASAVADTIDIAGGTSITTVATADTLTINGTPLINSDTMAGALTTNVASATSIVNYVATEIATAVASEMTYKGAFDPTAAAGAGSPDLDTITSAIGDTYTVTVAGTYNWTTGSAILEVGDVLIAETAGVLNNVADWTIVNKNLDTAEFLIFRSVLSDSGTAVADQIDDTLSILGGTGISTAVTADTLTITNDSPHIATNLSVGTVTATNVPVLSSTGTDITTLPAATATLAGIVTNAAQTFGGAKTVHSLIGSQATFLSTIDNFTVDCGTFT